MPSDSPKRRRISTASRIPPTFRGVGTTPACPKCGHNRKVIRVWFGGVKQWACGTHYKITSTKTRQPSLKDRLLHRMPEPDLLFISEVFPNRKARRAK